jgi:class 3 adenylate cyclase/tetratricopeptide (TPR) repeat protein
MTEREQLEQAIAALEAQRAILGDAVVDASITALRQQLAALEPPPPTEQKRKQVTVLFADVSGFTAMSETMDAEEVTETMNALWKRLDKAITEHGGTIDKHIGDAVMALWGAETAREDDPEWAIRASLAMQAALAALRDDQQVDLAMRIGLNTGPVFLGQVGTTGEYTAMGDTVNLASRLEQAAPVGGILISHDTYRHVRGVFDVQALDPITVKGKVEPIRVYVVQRAKPRAFRVGTRGVEGIETRMIGREAELKYLQDALCTAMEDGERRMVTIIGEAGMGKSRLLYEFENWIDLLPETIRYFKGRASLEMQNLPYALIRDLFSFRFQIQDSDRARVVRQKVEAGFGEVLGTDEQGQMKAHFIGQLLGFDFSDSPHLRGVLDDAQQLHDRALIYLSQFFQATTTLAPTAIFLEDIHWADDSSLDVVNHLALTTPDQQLLIACLTRSTLFERRPHWGAGQSFHTRLELRPLSKRDSRHLVEEILQKVKQVPVALRELVVSGAEGNPFYVEELIKMLIEDRVIIKGEERWRVEPAHLVTVRVPPTLTGVLQARLDSLPLRERTILQRASVVGRKFWDSAVVRISESASQRVSEPVSQRIGERETEIQNALFALQGKEMIFRRKASVFAGTQEYIFKHAILREVTYESVLKRVRRAYHTLVAEWLIEHSGERAGEYAGLIADHLELAGQAEQAATYLRRAGEQAAGKFANAEAVAYLSRALDLIPEGDRAERYALLLAREKVYDLQGEREAQAQDLTALKELLEALDDDWRRAEVFLRQANYAEVTGDYPTAIAAARAASDLAQVAQDVHSEAAGYLQGGRALWRWGGYEEARPQLEQALALAQATQLRQVEADSLRNLGIVSYYTGDYAGTRGYFEQALRIYREIGDRRGEGMTLNNLSHVFHHQGDYARARTYFEQTLRIWREIGDRWGELLGLLNLGLLFHHLDDNEAAREYSQQGLFIAQDIGERSREGDALTNLGHALAGLGRLAEAAAAYQQALALRRELGQSNLAMETLAGLARVALAQGNLSQAQAQVEEILSYLYLESNPLDGTQEPFRVYLTCYRVLRANQDPRAWDILSSAHNLLQEQAAKILDEELRRSFLENVAAHREIVSESANQRIVV